MKAPRLNTSFSAPLFAMAARRAMHEPMSSHRLRLQPQLPPGLLPPPHHLLLPLPPLLPARESPPQLPPPPLPCQFAPLPLLPILFPPALRFLLILHLLLLLLLPPLFCIRFPFLLLPVVLQVGPTHNQPTSSRFSLLFLVLFQQDAFLQH